MVARRRWAPEEEALLRVWTNEGVLVKEQARRLHRGWRSTWKKLNSLGLTGTRSCSIADRRARILSLAGAGLSPTAIATRLGMDRTCVWRFIQQEVEAGHLIKIKSHGRNSFNEYRFTRKWSVIDAKD